MERTGTQPFANYTAIRGRSILVEDVLVGSESDCRAEMARRARAVCGGWGSEPGDRIERGATRGQVRRYGRD